MWQIFIDRFSMVPGWSLGSGLLALLILVLLLFSFFRNIRSLVWFSLASLVTAGIFLLAIHFFPLFTDWLVFHHSDWSLLYLSKTIRIPALITHFLIAFSVFTVLGSALVLVLGMWSLLTFRWQRWRVILHRAFSESWMIFFFAVFTVLADITLGALLPDLRFDYLAAVFQLTAFLFCLQFFLRLVDTAHLKTPQLLMEFIYASGLWMLLFRFAADGVSFLGQPSPTSYIARSLFLNHLFSFFLCVLLLGILAHFFVKALFASSFFLERHRGRRSASIAWASRILLIGRKHSYAQQSILMGVILTAVLGMVLLLFVFEAWYLALVPAFFMAYFLQFYLLDRQDDWRVKGDLVTKRIESATNTTFSA